MPANCKALNTEALTKPGRILFLENYGAAVATDIESLIRQALARQNGFDPKVRAKIYQSSRNALAKMIAKAGVVPPQVINARSHSLEETISKIEAEFTGEVKATSQPHDPDPGIDPNAETEKQQQQDQPSPNSEQTPAPPIGNIEPVLSAGNIENNKITGYGQPELSAVPPSVSNPAVSSPTVSSPTIASPSIFSTQERTYAAPEPVSIQPDPVQAPPHTGNDEIQGHAPQLQYAEPNTGPAPQYVRPRRKPIRIIIWIAAIVTVIIAGWLAYTLTVFFLDQQSLVSSGGEVSEIKPVDRGNDFITILEPAQPGSLITAGNGTAEILSDISQPAIRIMSVRKPDARETPAKPMLLELEPGVLQSIAGKRVTVEIMAKSGNSGAATFSVSCQFGELGECGRKRFRIGLQPEAVIFSIEISADYKEGQRAFLAISTDVTSSANVSGKGAKIDIIYARIRTGG